MEGWKIALAITGAAAAVAGAAAAIYYFSPSRPETHARKAWRRGRSGKPMYSITEPVANCAIGVFDAPRGGEQRKEAIEKCGGWVTNAYEAGKAGKDWTTTRCEVLGVCR